MNFIAKTIPELRKVANDVSLPRKVRDTAEILWIIQHMAKIQELNISWEDQIK